MKPSNWPTPLPYIDQDVQHVGISHLRGLNALKLSKLRGLLVIRDSDKPLAVLMPYESYMAIQKGSNAR